MQTGADSPASGGHGGAGGSGNGSGNGWNGMLPSALRQVWRLIILVVGVTVVAVGVAMLVLPGPAIIVIPAGLAILATEFLWARRLLDRVRKSLKLDKLKEKVTGS